MAGTRKALKDVFFGDIYNWMIFILVVTVAISAYQLGYIEVVLPAMVAVLIAGGLDTAIKSYKKGTFYLSKSGIISGIFIGMLMTPNLPAVIITAAITILSKHIIKIKNRHIFNPANFGLMIAGLIGFGTSWWGSYALVPVVIFGAFILYRISKLKMVISFLIGYAFVTALLFGSIQSFVSLIVNSTILFFAFFMLTEHKTSPYTPKGQIVYGIFTGVLSGLLILTSQLTGIMYLSAYYLNIALAFGNILAFKVK